MCGIWALFGEVDDSKLRQALAECLRVAHRGPDATRIESVKDVPHSMLAFHRLEINDLTGGGMQPMRLNRYPHVSLICNGEIYNAFHLREAHEFEFESRCDVEVIIHLYERFGAEETAAMLDGIFTFVLVDTKRRRVVLGRDVFGVIPLFTFSSSEGVLGVCSEVKGLQSAASSHTAEISPFPPGHTRTYDLGMEGQTSFVSEKQAISIGGSDPAGKGMTLSSNVHTNVRNLLKAAVKKRLMTERRIGCLLSGGLDSSLIAALVVECVREAPNGFQHKGYPIQTFCIGMEGSPDVEYARLVAQHLKTEHHEVSFTPEEGFQAVRDVIYATESYDITTVRASVGMYLAAKFIKKNTDATIVFSGEGSDELCQGYIYFHKAPTPEEADIESRHLLRELYFYDNLRADRCIAAHGLELRVPFLDKAFTSYYLSISPEERQPQEGVEKYLLRKSFSDRGFLPDAVLWRPKEALSDGVAHKSKAWFQHLQDKIKTKVSESELSEAGERFSGNNIPTTKEAYYYRQVFEELFPNRHSLIPHYWMPKWCGDTNDPSARILSHYK